MNFIAVLFFTISCVYSASIPVVDNPCSDSELYFLRYFQPYPSDQTKYYECTPWNGRQIRDCRVGSRWNSWLGRCSDERLEKSLNLTMSQFNETSFDASMMPPMSFNITSCKYIGNETCLNRGICNQFPTGGRCECPANFTGEYCQILRNGSYDVFRQLINESFSLDLYRLNRPLIDEYYAYNGSIDTSSINDSLTRDRIAQYVALYPNGTMRFDMLVNYLIQDYLSLVYPWQFFLQEFGYASEIQMGYVNAIPSLLMSSKYAYDRYYDMWAVYESVLRQLVDYLPRHLPQINREAELFFEIYDGIFRQFEQVSNFSAMRDPEFFNQSFITVDMIKSKILRNFNETLSLSYDLFNVLNAFDEEVGVRSVSQNASFIEEALANFTMSPNVTRIIGDLSDSNAEIWDSLSFYGFWYVVSEFIDHQRYNFSQNSSFILNGTTVARLIKPAAKPVNAFNHSSTSSHGRVAPVFQALQGDEGLGSDEVPVSSDSERLVSGNKTAVLGKLQSFNTSKWNTSAPVTSHLIGNFSQLVGNFSQLIGNFSQTMPLHGNFSKLVGNFSQLIGNVSHPAQLVGNFSQLVGNFSQLVGNVSLPEHLVGNFSQLVGNWSQLVGNVSLPEHLVGNFSQLVGNWSQLVGNVSSVKLQQRDLFPVSNVSVPVTSPLFGNVSALVGNVSALVGNMSALVGDVWNSTLNSSVPVPWKLVNSNVSMPMKFVADFPERLFGWNSTVVNGSVPATSPLFGNVSALVGNVSALVGNMSALVGGPWNSTFVNSTVQQLVGEWNSSASQLTGSRSNSSLFVRASNISSTRPLVGNMSALVGNVSALVGNVSALVGNVSALKFEADFPERLVSPWNVTVFNGSVPLPVTSKLVSNVSRTMQLVGNVSALVGNVSALKLEADFPERLVGGRWNATVVNGTITPLKLVSNFSVEQLVGSAQWNQSALNVTEPLKLVGRLNGTSSQLTGSRPNATAHSRASNSTMRVQSFSVQKLEGEAEKLFSDSADDEVESF